MHLRSRSPARDDRQPNSPEGQPAWKREEHRYYRDWRGGKGKSKSKTKEKGRGKSKSVQSGHWEWHPNNKLTPKEISAILMHHAIAEVHQRVKLSWVEVKSLGATVRHCCKPLPRHTRVNIMPECWNHKKWSFVETEGGESQKVEECEPVDNETSFDDEKPTCCHVYLVPEWLIQEEQQGVALYSRQRPQPNRLFCWRDRTLTPCSVARTWGVLLQLSSHYRKTTQRTKQTHDRN